MCWCIVATRYRRANRKHLMALFKTTFHNHINRLANKRTATVTEVALEELPDLQFCPDAEMAQCLAEAPQPLRRCLQEMLAHPERTDRPIRRRKYGKETTTEWILGMAGIRSDSDVAEQLKEFLRRPPATAKK